MLALVVAGLCESQHPITSKTNDYNITESYNIILFSVRLQSPRVRVMMSEWISFFPCYFIPSDLPLMSCLFCPIAFSTLSDTYVYLLLWRHGLNVRRVPSSPYFYFSRVFFKTVYPLRTYILLWHHYACVQHNITHSVQRCNAICV